MQRFRDITQDDVGRSVFRAFGTTWQTSSFIGRITSLDVGKRVYLSGDIVQVENDEQFAQRKAAAPAITTSKPPPRPAMPSSAHDHFARSRVHSAEAQRLAEGIQRRTPSHDAELARALAFLREETAKMVSMPSAKLLPALKDLKFRLDLMIDSIEAVDHKNGR